MKVKVLLIVALSFGWFASVGANPASAQVYGTSANRRDTNNLLVRINTKADTLQRMIQNDLDRSTVNSTNREDRVMESIRDFQTSIDALRAKFDSRQDTSSEVQDVLNRAAFIDRFISRNTVSYQTKSQWTSLRSDLDTLARYNNVSWNWNQSGSTYGGNSRYGNSGYGNSRVYTASDPQMSSLLDRIQQRTVTFRQRAESSTNSRTWNNRNNESMTSYIAEFENATDRLKQHFDARQSTSADVSDVLTQATYIDQYVKRNRMPYAVQSQWRNLRTDLSTLATYYRVSWNWNQSLPPFTARTYPANNDRSNGYPSTGGYGRFDNRLTGTYRLNRSQSDDVNQVLDRSARSNTSVDREHVRARLSRRLNSPDVLVIDKNGQTVTVGSSISPQITFDVDGVAHTETTNSGRTVRTTATAASDSVTIAFEGDRANDFYVTFLPVGNNQLRVTRRIYLDNSNEQVTVTSVYDKVDNVAQWTQVNTGSTSGGNSTTNATYNDFYVPNGTRLTTRLTSRLDSAVSQVGDRITMEVTSPDQYSGAIIEGRVAQAEKSGRISGRASLSFDLDTVRMPNGQTYRFAGIIDSVRAPNGDTVSVNNEGSVRDNNQTTKTVTRAGIGAALGALIGAIAGGGQGAAVGAAIGAGAGAGTVFIQGRDNVVLEQGTEINITASAPANVGYNR